MARSERRLSESPQVLPKAARIAAAEAAYAVLLDKIEQLRKAMLDSDEGLPARTWPLPLYGSNAKPCRSWGAPRLDGQWGRLYATAVICATRYAPDQPSRAVVRAPGILAASQATLTRAQEVNAAKGDLRQATLGLAKTQQGRHRLLGKIDTDLCVMHAFRYVHCLNEKPRRVNMGWTTSASSNKRIVCGERARELRVALRRPPPPGHDEGDWRQEIRETIQALELLPSNEIMVEVAPMAPHPRAAVRDQKSARYYRAAALPLLYPDDGTGLPSISDLPDFDYCSRSTDQKTIRREPTPIHPRSRIYRYRPGYRQYAERCCVD